MTCQSAARGGFLRTLHFSALPRPTGVIGLQSQLRRICPVPNSGLGRSQLPAISSIQLLSQSKSFATASTVPGTTKAPRTKKSSEKTAQKPLTDKQKEQKKAQQYKAQIDQLKVTALAPPKKLASNFFALALAEQLGGMKDTSQYKPGEAFKIAAAQAKSLSAQEEERFKAQAEENKTVNSAAYNSWIQSHTPLQIKEANAARRTLSRLVGKEYRSIKDDRQVKNPSSAYACYLKERLTGAVNQAQSKENFEAAAKAWKGLTELEKERYHELHIQDRARYEREYQEVYGIPAPKQAQNQS